MKKGRKKQRDFLYDDLIDLSTDEIYAIHGEIKDKIAAKVKEHDKIQQERNELVEFNEDVRSILMSPRSPEINELISRLNIARINRENAEKRRNELDLRVPPSPNDIIESLKQRHKLLWGANLNRLQENPTLDEEIDLFESYFEYQAMYEVAIQSDEQQKIWIQSINEKNSVMKELRIHDLKDIDNQKISQLKDKYPNKVIGWKSVEESSKRIMELEQRSQSWRNERRSLVMEMMRIESFLSIEGKKTKKKNLKIKSGEVLEKAETGESLTLDDLSALISTGDIGKITKNKQNKTGRETKNGNKKSKRRRSKTKRGNTRSKNRTREEDGND